MTLLEAAKSALANLTFFYLHGGNRNKLESAIETLRAAIEDSKTNIWWKNNEDVTYCPNCYVYESTVFAAFNPMFCENDVTVCDGCGLTAGEDD